MNVLLLRIVPLLWLLVRFLLDKKQSLTVVGELAVHGSSQYLTLIDKLVWITSTKCPFIHELLNIGIRPPRQLLRFNVKLILNTLSPLSADLPPGQRSPTSAHQVLERRRSRDELLMIDCVSLLLNCWKD